MDGRIGEKKVSQAVVLADDFTTNLTPMQNVFPSILMPVLNVPLLDYLVETLVKSRIEEFFLYCSSHVDLLKAYIKQKNWTTISISLIVSEGCRSLGDALRDIDTKGCIRGNFVLIRGDAFVNADLKNALDVHINKSMIDKGATMTMLLRNLGSVNNSLLKQETSLVVSDKTTKKMLHYSKLKNDDKKVKLELNWFLDHNEIEINTCFLDTHVYLCSPSVLLLFADNFDFQTMEDFIRGVLMNEEILDSRIYWQQLNSQDYSLPIVSWSTYHTLSRDLLHRHSFPLVPNNVPSLKNFIYMPRSTYKHRSATLAKGCILEKDSIFCQNSVIGNDTFVTRSVIGDNCTVGCNVTMKNAHILSNVRIDDNCTITNSIVYPNAVIRNSAQINGCIVCPKTTVDARMEYTNSILEAKEIGTCATKISDIDVTTEFQFFKDNDTEEHDSDSTDVSSSDEDSERNSPIPDDTNMFLSEVIDSLLRGYQEKLNCENLILEINSSRYAYNVTMREVTYNVIKAILSLPFHYCSETKEILNTPNYQKNLKIMVSYFHTILLNYVKTEDAQDDCLCAIEDVACTSDELLLFLPRLLHIFYDGDILSEEKILEWYKSNDEDSDEFQSKKVKTAAQTFIKWLLEAVEDSASEDD